MPSTSFTAFYPSKPFWAGNPADLQVLQIGDWFYNQMAEEVHETNTNDYILKVCRDGRILVRITRLERENSTIEDSVLLWGEYLNYLNAYYLLLDSAALEVDRFSYFNLHEITNRDAFRIAYESGAPKHESVGTESISSVFQMGRYLSTYRSDIPLKFDLRITSRQVISLAAISHAGKLFGQVIESPGSEKSLASFAKSLSEYKIGNYETSIVLAWFITEATISKLWKAFLASHNHDLPGGSKRINSKRNDFLTGRDFTASIVSNMLELSGVLDTPLFNKIDKVRWYRNQIAHSALTFVPDAIAAQLAIEVAQQMIERQWKISFLPNTNYVTQSL